MLAEHLRTGYYLVYLVGGSRSGGGQIAPRKPFVLVEDHVADRDIGGHGLEVVHHFVALVLAGVEKIYLAGLVEGEVGVEGALIGRTVREEHHVALWRDYGTGVVLGDLVGNRGVGGVYR